MVHHQRLIVDTHGQIGHAQGVRGEAGQALQAPGQVIAQITQGPAGKGQSLGPVVRQGETRAQGLAQQGEGVVAGDQGAPAPTHLGDRAPGDQGPTWLGDQDVVAPATAPGPVQA